MAVMAPPKSGPWTGLLDLSENNSTLGVPPAVMASMKGASATGVPSFIRAVVARDGVPVDHVFPGNGTLELIHAAARTLARPGAPVAVFGPTFGEFVNASSSRGAVVVEFRAGEEDGFRWDIPGACRALKEARPSAVFLCNPNNPTGEYLSHDEVGEVLAAAGEATLILDEAYAGLVAERWTVPGEWLRDGRLLVLRSVSKACAMEFLGAGYAVGAPALLAGLSAMMGAQVMNPVTAAGAAAYLGDPSLERDAGRVLREALENLCRGLEAEGFAVHRGAANFAMVRTGNARAFRWELMRFGVLAKELDGYGLPGWIRVASPPVEFAGAVAQAFAGAREALR
jgi:histidinol-phosphate aminotransferase